MTLRRASLLVVLVAGLALAGCLSDGSSGAPAEAEEDAPRNPSPNPSRDAGGSGDGNATGDTSDGNGTRPATDPPDNTTEDPGFPTAFSTWGCETTFTMLEVRHSWAAQHTPEGFEPITFTPPSALVPGAPDPGARASFAVASNHCDRISYEGGNATTRSDVAKLYYGVFVDPPDTYESGEKTYLWVFRVVTDDPGEADLLSRWGLPADAGTVSLAVKADRGQSRSWTVEAGGGDASARVDLQTPGETAASGSATFRWFGPGEDGGVERAMDYTVEASNSTQNRLAAGAMNAVVDLDAPDAPYPAPTASPIAITRWTPSEEAAQHAELVTFEE